MKKSVGRILTSHTGSLPRPDDLAQMLLDAGDGKPVDRGALAGRAAEAVREAVHKQAEAGVDVVSDGEQSKPGFVNYVRDRMTGFTGQDKPFRAADLLDFPEIAATRPGANRRRMPACTGPVKYVGQQAVKQDIANFKAALQEVNVEDAFIPATSPGEVVLVTDNQFYVSREEFMRAVAEALKEEYNAIVAAGFNLQIDACDLAMEGHVSFAGRPLTDFRTYLRAQVDAINQALEDIPADKVRLHLCWGNYPGTHHRDRELKDFIDLVLEVKAHAISFEAANPRHGHEWRVWQNVDVRDRILIPGVIDTCTNYIEHPELVAERIIRFGRIVGPENVIAGTDCGFSTFVGMSAVFPRVAYAKLAALAEGAAIASRELF